MPQAREQTPPGGCPSDEDEVILENPRVFSRGRGFSRASPQSPAPQLVFCPALSPVSQPPITSGGRSTTANKGTPEYGEGGYFGPSTPSSESQTVWVEPPAEWIGGRRRKISDSLVRMRDPLEKSRRRTSPSLRYNSALGRRARLVMRAPAAGIAANLATAESTAPAHAASCVT